MLLIMVYYVIIYILPLNDDRNELVRHPREPQWRLTHYIV
jgi:hypothetical protein